MWEEVPISVTPPLCVCVSPPFSQNHTYYAISIAGRAWLHKARLLGHPIVVPCPHGHNLISAPRTMGAGNGSGVVVQTKRGRPLNGAQLSSLSLPRLISAAP